MPPIAVYEVATLLRDVQHRADRQVQADDLHQSAVRAARRDARRRSICKQKLGIGFGETTPDGMFTLKEGECFGACGDAPVLLVNNKRMCSWMKPDELDRCWPS